VTTYAASEDYRSELAESDGESIEIPLPDGVITCIQNYPDAEPIQVLAQTSTDPDLRDDVVEAIDAIHGDADAGDDERDDQEESDDGDELGQPVSTLPELRRPVRGFNPRVLCPACESELSDAIGAPCLPTDRLHASARTRVDRETTNVRGYECEDRSLVLAVDPNSADIDIGPSKGWIPARGVFADGSKRDILLRHWEVEL
jgi:hypothetical protein